MDPGSQAKLAFPHGVAVDGAGNLYIADTSSHRILRVNTEGTITTFAGTGEMGYSGDGGPAVQAQLNGPFGVAVDGAGNLYIADTLNYRIRRVDTEGTITTFAGTGEKGNSGDGDPAIQTLLNNPYDVAVDTNGNLYIADTSNHRILRVDIAGTITTFAGTGDRGFSGDGGPAVQALLNDPYGVAVDTDGNLYIADTLNQRIRRVDTEGTIATFAGTGDRGFSGDGGPAVQALLDRPRGVAADTDGNLYIADTLNQRIRRVDTEGTITTFAGTGNRGFSGDGGPAVAARLNFPTRLAVDGAGNLYIADTDNHSIRVVTRSSSHLPSPTNLTATAVSTTQINLAWRDNSSNETGFRVQRRLQGTANWIQIGTTPANTTMFSDVRLVPGGLYHYRVQAFNDTQSSAFSNEATETTRVALPPTLTRFTPTRGPVGTQVTLTGIHLLGATAVLFNGVPAARFEVVSGTSIEAVVPLEATSGPISVITPGGTGVSAESFTVITDSGIRSRLFVPIVLRSQGRTVGSLFTSELTLTNRGTTTAAIHYTYSAAFGGGTGTARDSLEAGRQRVIPDAIAYLTSLGVPIAGRSAGGTLRVDFSNLSSPSDAAVTVRVSTPVEEGRVGLAYFGLKPPGLLTGSAFIAGLRQNSQDRSNVAVQNAGDTGEGSITLRVTVFSGDSAALGRSFILPDLTLPPGGFHQYNGILTEAGFENGYVKVERVRGTAGYYAYGVINDQVNSDGSFVFPVTESSLVGKSGQTLPVIIETGNFRSELTVTNFSTSDKQVDFSFVADGVDRGDDTAEFSLELKAGHQFILPDIVEELRGREVEGIGRAGRAYVGALFATPAEGGHERDCDRSEDGGSRQARGAVQPLLQRGALWQGFD